MADSFPLGVQHRGIRFHLGSDKDALRLLLTMVRDGVATVEQAMDCIKFEERPTQETSEGRCICVGLYPSKDCACCKGSGKCADSYCSAANRGVNHG
jgi:hypothetical protein